MVPAIEPRDNRNNTVKGTGGIEAVNPDRGNANTINRTADNVIRNIITGSNPARNGPATKDSVTPIIIGTAPGDTINIITLKLVNANPILVSTLTRCLKTPGPLILTNVILHLGVGATDNLETNGGSATNPSNSISSPLLNNTTTDKVSIPPPSGTIIGGLSTINIITLIIITNKLNGVPLILTKGSPPRSLLAIYLLGIPLPINADTPSNLLAAKNPDASISSPSNAKPLNNSTTIYLGSLLANTNRIAADIILNTIPLLGSNGVAVTIDATSEGGSST